MVVYMNQARRILQNSLLSFHHTTTRCMNNNHHQYYRIIINNIIPIRLFDYNSHHKIKTVNYHSTGSCNHNNHNNLIIGTTIQQQYNQQQQQQQQQQRLICPVRMMSTLNQGTYRTSTRIISNNILFKLNHSTTTSSNSIRTFSTAVATKTEVNTSTDDVTTTKTDTTNTNDIPSIPPILWTTHRLNQQQIQKVDNIFHKILWLDLFESSMLNDIMNEKMGITFTNKQTKQLMNLMEQRAHEAAGNISSNSNNNNNDNVEEEVAGPVLVDIKLTSFDAASKIKVIKEVRSILSLGLKEAKEMVESAPITLQKGIKEEVANELKIKLETVGAKIEIV